MKRIKLIQARLKKGVSQEVAAGLLGVSRAAWSLWEMGKVDPHPATIGSLCSFFGVSDPADLDLDCSPAREEHGVPVRDTTITAQENREEPVSPPVQNQLLSSLIMVQGMFSHTLTSSMVPFPERPGKEGPFSPHAASDLSIGAFTPSLPSIEQIPSFPPPTHTPPINTDLLQTFDQLIEICRTLSEGKALTLAETLLWTILPTVAFHARTSAETRTQAAALASEGYLLAASLVGHRNHLLERLHLSERALQYGELADDLSLQVVALRQIGISYDCLRQPANVLETYQRTFPYLDAVSPLLRACIYADVSGAYAQLGKKQEASRFIGMAYTHFPAQHEQEQRALRTICRYSSLVFWDGLNHLLLDDPAGAERLFECIDGLHPVPHTPERNRAEVLNYQVETFLALGKMDQACAYLEAAIEAARTVGSVRRFQETRVLLYQLQTRWPQERRVRQLQALFVR